MNKPIPLVSIAGWILGIVAAVNFAMQHGKRWEFNWYGCPVDLIAEDGLHYQDGTEINEFTLMAMKNGPGPELWLFVYASWIFVIGYTWYADRCWQLRNRAQEKLALQTGARRRASSP